MANVAILTSFRELNPWYSLTGIVKDQIRMLSEYGNNVILLVNEKFDLSNLPNHLDCTVLSIVPDADLIDYQNGQELSAAHRETADRTTVMLAEVIKQHNIDTIFTHDIVFTGWNRPYGEGIKQLNGKTPGVIWMHWIHSIPSQRDWWHMADYGPGHKLIYPNKTDALHVAEAFHTTLSSVRVIPHIKDLRTMYHFSASACEIIDRYPALMQADIVQILPASSERFESKGVDEVIKIMAFIKSLGVSVCLMVANQWATTQEHYANLKEYEVMATKYGLVPGKDFFFSSLMPDIAGNNYRVGIPSDILFELMQLCNLFIFPTRGETFGLVLPEISLASGALCVLNRSLQMQREISGGHTLFFDFGAYNVVMQRAPEAMDDYLRQIALAIMGRMQENDGIMTRTFMRKCYNYDYLYRQYYAPIMAEARVNS